MSRGRASVHASHVLCPVLCYGCTILLTASYLQLIALAFLGRYRYRNDKRCFFCVSINNELRPDWVHKNALQLAGASRRGASNIGGTGIN